MNSMPTSSEVELWRVSKSLVSFPPLFGDFNIPLDACVKSDLSLQIHLDLASCRIGNISSGSSSYAYSTYTFPFTALDDAHFVGFAFRNDPAYFQFTNVRLVVQGTTTNLLSNGGFNLGGTNIRNSFFSPYLWGTWYQRGIVPAAAGRLENDCGDGRPCWYDGAIRSFDGLYQAFAAQSNIIYEISFELKSSVKINGLNVQVLILACPCATGTGVGTCRPTPTSGFVARSTPFEAGATDYPTLTPSSVPSSPTTDPTLVPSVSPTPLPSTNPTTGPCTSPSVAPSAPTTKPTKMSKRNEKPKTEKSMAPSRSAKNGPFRQS